MHPQIPELKNQYRQGKISRREFMRTSALLGLSLSSISAFLAACSSGPAAPTQTATQPVVAATTRPSATPLPPTATAVAGPKRGGELQMVAGLQQMEDPASAQWAQDIVFRNVAEYLTVTNQDNVTVPWLLEKWEPSEDLKTWTLYVRQGIHFNHGPELTADDVVWNIQRWLDPDTGSSTQGLMGGYLSPNNVEKVDAYTVKLHLDRPQIAIPEHLYNWVNVILSKDFEGNWEQNPVGTGPFTLAEFIPEERAVLKARADYWRKDKNGQPLPYLDGIRYINLTDTASQMAALASGEVDLVAVSVPLLATFEGNPDIVISSQVSSGTHVIRMRADKAPFDDIRIRNAIKACQDRQAFLEALTRGYGDVADDYHVAPIHPEYCPMEVQAQDYEKAKALLAEAGYENGLNIEMSVMDDENYLTVAQLLQGQCEPAGIHIKLNTMPSSLYWDQWLDVDFAVTFWGHRALGIMVLALAYKSGADWNETHWSNARFDQLLEQAESTVDVEQRRSIMCELQTIMKEEGPVAIPYWSSTMYAHTKGVQGFRAAAQNVPMVEDVWLDKEA